MRLVVVGASGNLGTALLRRLADSGSHEVIGVARRVPHRVGPYGSVSRWAPVDVGATGAEYELQKVFTGADAVVNFAWGFQPTRKPDLLRRTGVAGSANVVAAAAAAGVPHVVHTSSVGSYAPRRDLVPVDETYPVTGVGGSTYSQHKVAAEVHLDAWESTHPGQLVISRLRPGFVVQHDAGAALFRYGLPGWLPGIALTVLPVLPLDSSFTIPVVHSDDVADAVVRLLISPAGGAFNLAAQRAVTRTDLAAILHARPVNLSPTVLEKVVNVSWRAQLQPLDGGWIRLAYAVPLLDSGRAHTELGWTPQHDPVDALSEAIQGMRHGAGAGGPVLRPRSQLGDLRRVLQSGTISRRACP